MEELLNKLPNKYFNLINDTKVPTKNKTDIDKILEIHNISKPYILYEGPDEFIKEFHSDKLQYLLIRNGYIINPFNMHIICEDKYDNESWIFYQGAHKVICLTDKNKFYSALKALRSNVQVIVLQTALSTFLFTKYVNFYTESKPLLYQIENTIDLDPTYIQYFRSIIDNKQNILKMLLQNSDSKDLEEDLRPLSPPILPKYDGDDENITIEFKKDETEERITDVNITLLTHYFNHSDPKRQLEFDTALNMNLANEFVKEVIIFITDKSTILSESIPKNKLKIVNHNKWPTYKDMIEYANDNCKGIIGLIHLDCYLDNKGQWETLYTELDNNNIIYSLSCHETDMKKIWKNQIQSNTLYCYKQDAWIFLSPFLSPPPNIEFGLRNASSAFAHQIITNSNYTLYNLCNRYRIMHLDNIIKAEDKIKKNIVDSEYYAVPDYDAISAVPIDFLINKLNIPDQEIYKIKCNLLSKFMKLKK